MKQLTIAVLLVMALLTAAGKPRTQSCDMKMATVVATNCGCCATMKSCLMQQTPVHPTATPRVAHEAIVMIAPVLQQIFASVVPEPIRYSAFVAVEAPAHSAPSPALLCTFLI